LGFWVPNVFMDLPLKFEPVVPDDFAGLLLERWFSADLHRRPE
jgi:hypothetical protein